MVYVMAAAPRSECGRAADLLERAGRAFPDAKKMLYVLDGECLSFPEIEVLPAASLFQDRASYLEHAFFFRRGELADECILRAAAAIHGTDIVCLCDANGRLPEIFPHELPLTDEVCAAETVGNRQIGLRELAETQQLAATGVVLVGRGQKTARWLEWCAKKFEYLFSNGYGVAQTWERAQGMAFVQRDFTHKWRDYAPFFGCHMRYWSATPIENTEKPGEYRFDRFEDGTTIPQLLRDWFGKDYRLREACDGDPFAHRELFTDVSVLTGDTHPVPVPPALEAIYQRRIDLQLNIPDHFGRHREAIVRWFLDYGVGEMGLERSTLTKLEHSLNEYQRINAENATDRRTLAQKIAGRVRRLLGRVQPSEAAEQHLPAGVNLCGFIKGDFGLGESARILARAFEAAGIPYTVVDFQGASAHSYSNREFAHKITNEFRYRVNVIDTNGDGQELFLRDVAPEALEHRYNIGYWAWELPEFPQGWEKAFPVLDEVWTCSDFTTKAIQSKSPVPVFTVPHALTVHVQPGRSRADFGLPEDKFIFLMSYDVRSFSARKNPQAAVEAFLKAFENDDSVCLLLKLNVPSDWDGEDGLLNSLRKHRNVLTYAGNLKKPDFNALVNCCDAFVSLHRSEGFGLGPAEAMYLGKPAVLTNWSGNTQYMREDACCPVSYRIVEIDQDYGPYKKGCHWAEADTDDAARWMRRLVDDPEFYRKVSEAGQRVIREEFSPQAVGSIARKRLEELGMLEQT